ncbi:MAG: NAD-dependent epimerase/dehydratase family protein, partial [Bacteroidota bacterium]
MQTILGAGGAIGRELAKSLRDYTTQVRLVSRNPQKVNEQDQLISADLMDSAAVLKATEGSEIVYLTAGLLYDTKIWRSMWPTIMKNVVDACASHKAKMVFFDNIYMYPRDTVGRMTEENPIGPETKKGQVRAQIFRELMEAVEQGRVEALVARAADFYGPGILGVSVLTESVFKPLSEGKKASILGGVDFVHSFTYTPDAGKATALLGNTPEAFGEVWHLPTAGNPWTMRQWTERFALE